MLPVYDLVFAKICDVIKKIHFQVSKNILLLDKKKKKICYKLGTLLQRMEKTLTNMEGKSPKKLLSQTLAIGTTVLSLSFALSLVVRTISYNCKSIEALLSLLIDVTTVAINSPFLIYYCYNTTF